MRDVANRAFKTFIEVFLIELIPNIVMLLQNYENYDLSKWYVYAIQFGLPALATGISAAWNSIENYLKSKNQNSDNDLQKG